MWRFAILVSALTAMVAAVPLSGAAAGSLDLSRFVVVGDSLTAGYQNSCLFAPQQANGFTSLIAGRAGADLPLPLIGAPGAPPCLVVVDPGPPPVIERLPGPLGSRLDSSVRARNISVPGMRIVDVTNPDPDNSFHFIFQIPFAEVFDLVMEGQDNLPRSQLEVATDLDPTALLVWLGSNDVLLSATAGVTFLVTPPEIFAPAYANMMATLAATGAPMVLANIPDVATVPYFTSAEEVAETTGLPFTVFGLEEGDYVTPLAWDVIMNWVPGVSFLPDQAVLDAAEVADLQAVTAAYNAIIAEQADLYGAALVDMNAVLRFIDQFGIVIDGRRLTTGFLGGIFTLDGIHPTNTAQAVIANEFIRAMNRTFGAGIRPFSQHDIAAIMDSDPLVLEPVGTPPLAPTALEVLRGLDVVGGGS